MFPTPVLTRSGSKGQYRMDTLSTGLPGSPTILSYSIYPSLIITKLDILKSKKFQFNMTLLRFFKRMIAN